MPMDIKDYHHSWRQISLAVRKKAGWRCELCDVANSALSWRTGKRIVLTVHHIDADKGNNDPLNLLALCQRCHLKLDLARHIANRKLKRRSNNEEMFKGD